MSTGDDELNGPDLRPYAGHGTFIAGVVRCIAPVTRVYVEGFAIGGVGGGGILESDLVVQLEEALDHDPQVINLSAGCRTRLDLPSIALEDLLPHPPRKRDCVLVAAAGNDSTLRAVLAGRLRLGVGVGSLDRDGRVSTFSNFGVSADVYALGRNLVNAFPDGTVRVPRDTGQGRRPGLQHRDGAVERHVVLGPGRRRADRPGDLRDRVHGQGGGRRRPRGSRLRLGPGVGPIQVLRQPYA